ncbi:MAG: hypothetical protein A2162_11405 [Deltaproteobacteria bacterium RBG_13_52_11b]|nr:MAG: hypothetical protein A2162_11405 [Deltaproteobacteria bacterium RBG_13_52_11b]
MVKRWVTSFSLLFTLALFWASVCPPADSADFPKKPIKLIVTADIGGGEDSEARAIAPFAEKHLGVNVVIENLGAAGGKIAFERFQKAEPDGYTLITYTFPKSIIIEYMTKTSYRTKDFTPIYAWSRSNHLLVVHTDTWKTLDEFVKAGKTRNLSGGLPGRGTPSQLAGLETVDKLGIKVNWVPYDGAAGSLAALAGKHLDFTICIPSTATALIDAGKIRPLVLFSEERDPFFPDVPLSRDLGFDITPIPGIRGASAPPNTPAPIIKVLEAAFSKAVKEPGFMEWAKKRKVVLHALTAQEFSQVVEATYPKAIKFQTMLTEK